MKRIEPEPGQESVWDYPRPPSVEDSTKHIKVVFNDVVIADTQRAKRVIETSSPPVYYIPPEDIKVEYSGRTVRISVDYVVPVDFLIFQHDMHFTPSSENRSLI